MKNRYKTVVLIAMALALHASPAFPVDGEFGGFYRVAAGGDARFITVLPSGDKGNVLLFDGNRFLVRASALADKGRLVFTPVPGAAVSHPSGAGDYRPGIITVDPAAAVHGAKYSILYRRAGETNEFLSYDDIMLVAVIFSECVKKSRMPSRQSIQPPEYAYAEVKRELGLRDDINRHLLTVYSYLDYFTNGNPAAPGGYRGYCAALKSSGFGREAKLPWGAGEDDAIVRFVNSCIKGRYQKKIVLEHAPAARIESEGRTYGGVWYPDLRMLDAVKMTGVNAYPGSGMNYEVIPAHISGVVPALADGGRPKDAHRLDDNYADLYIYLHRVKGIVALQSVGYMNSEIFIRKDLDFSDEVVAPLIDGSLRGK